MATQNLIDPSRETNIGGMQLPQGVPNKTTSRSFIVGPVIVTVCAFLSSVAYAIYVFKTDRNLELGVLVLPFLPFFFALPNLILSVVVFHFTRRTTHYFSVLTILCLLAVATPWAIQAVNEYSVTTGHAKAKRLWLEQNAGKIILCGNNPDRQYWETCIQDKVRTQDDLATCKRQGFSFTHSTPVATIDLLCDTAFQKSQQ